MNTGFKAQLKGVLTNAVSYFQDSGDPNDACIKAANEAGFNADQADRLVETFNTARVICNYKVAADKASACSLADKKIVRGGLSYREEKKEASYTSVDYGCYKQAEVDWVVPEKKEAEFTLKEEPISKAAAEFSRVRALTTLRECIKSAQEEARAANAMADEIAEKVAHQLSRNVSIDDVHDKVARLVRAYATDDRYAPGVEKVGEFIPESSDPSMELHIKYAAAHVIDTDDLQDVLPAIKEASDFVAEASALEAYAIDLEKAAQVIDLLNPGGQDQSQDEFSGKSKQELEELLLKERIGNERRRREEYDANAASRAKNDAAREKEQQVRLDQLLQRGAPAPKPAAKPSGGGGPGKNLTSFLAYLTDSTKAQYDSQAQARIEKATAGVNNLRRQLILQDLLVNDKVLSQENPNAVAAAFRSIHQVSPDTTLNKEMLRSMLRSAVQSVAISPYDAKTLADVDKARRQAYSDHGTTKEN